MAFVFGAGNGPSGFAQSFAVVGECLMHGACRMQPSPSVTRIWQGHIYKEGDKCCSFPSRLAFGICCLGFKGASSSAIIFVDTEVTRQPSAVAVCSVLLLSKA